MDMKDIIEEWKRKKYDIESQYYPILCTCKEDMIEEFVASPKIRLEIEQFTGNQMRTIAEKLGAVLLDSYWAALRDAVEKELNR